MNYPSDQGKCINQSTGPWTGRLRLADIGCHKVTGFEYKVPFHGTAAFMQFGKQGRLENRDAYRLGKQRKTGTLTVWKTGTLTVYGQGKTGTLTVYGHEGTSRLRHRKIGTLTVYWQEGTSRLRHWITPPPHSLKKTFFVKFCGKYGRLPFIGMKEQAGCAIGLFLPRISLKNHFLWEKQGEKQGRLPFIGRSEQAGCAIELLLPCIP